MGSTDREIKTDEREGRTPLSRSVKVLRRWVVSSGTRRPAPGEAGHETVDHEDFQALLAAQATAIDGLLGRLDEEHGPVSDEIKRQIRASD